MSRHLRAAVLILLVMLISIFTLPTRVNSQPTAAYAPVVIDVWPMPGTEMLDLDPLSITFDQPMDKRSTESAVQFDPPLKGVFNWLDAQTLAFTPRDGWPREVSYKVTVTAAAQSASGAKPDSPYTFEVQTLGMLAIGQVVPARAATEVALNTPIIISFSRPMRALGQQGKPLGLTFDPQISGSGEWVSDTIYQFTPRSTLKINTTYTVRVDPVASADGARLKEAYTWQFTTLPPKVVQVSVFPITSTDVKPNVEVFDASTVDLDNVALDKDIEIRFTDQVDQASVESSFSMTAAGEPIPGKFNWRWTGTEMILRFDPKNLLKPATQYHVTVTAAARTAGVVADKPTEFDFRSMPYPAILSTQPANGATNVLWPNNRPVIRFNTTRINAKSLAEHLTISPAPKSKPDINLYYQYASLDFEVQPNTTYAITVAAGVKDSFGNTIDTPYTFSYTTGGDVVTIQGDNSDAPTDWRFTVPLNADLMITSAKRVPTTFTVNFYDPLTLPIQLYRVSPADMSTARLRSHNSLSYWNSESNGYYDNSGHCQPPSFVQPANQIRAWNEQLSGDDHTQEVALSDSSDKALPLGLYWITMGDRTQVCHQRSNLDDTDTVEYGPEWQFGLAVVTANITMKRGPHDVFIWVTDLETTAPIANAKVTLYAGGTAIATGTTNQQGVAQLPASWKENAQIVITAEGEGVFAAWHDYWTTGDRHPADPTLGYDYNDTIWIPRPEETQGYLYTDRPIYRPGDTVYFRGILRDKRDVTYPVSQKKDVYVRAGSMYGDDGTPQPFYNVKMTLNEYGTFSGSFKIPDDTKFNNGYVNLWATFNEALTEDHYGYGYLSTASDVAISFTVAEYRTPEFEVKVNPDQQAAVVGDAISAKVQASYYFGGSVSNANVDWRSFVTWGDFNYTGTGGWQFGYASTYGDYSQWNSWDDLYPEDSNTDTYYYYASTGPSGSALTDDHGQAAIDTIATLPDASNGRTYTRTMIIEATMTDESGLSISGRGSLVVYPSSIFVGARLDGRPKAGQPYTVQFITVNPDSQPRSDRPINISLQGYQWNRASWGNWKDILSTTVMPTTDGTADYTFTDLQPGVYLMTVSATDEKGRESSTISYFWVPDSSSRQSLSTDPKERITLTSDKIKYTVGETAHLLIPVPFEGASKVLITTEREGVESYAIVDASGGILAYDLQLTDPDAPNVWVQATFITAVSADSPYPKFRLSAPLGIGVVPTEPFLNVQLTASTEQAKPGETVSFDVSVTDRDGKPVTAEVGLKLVDKAVLALLPPNSTTMRRTFFNSQTYISYTELSIDSLIENLVNTYKTAVPGRGGGGGGGGEGAPSVRERYETTPLWLPHVITDASGKAHVSVKLPDNLTTWELDARVLTQSADMQVGQATTEIMTTLPLIVRPVAPRFMIAGDEMQLAAIINNNTANAQTVTAKLQATGVTLKSAAEQSVTIPANGRMRVTWPVTVENASGADLTFSAVGDGVSDAAKPLLRTGEGDTIPIYQYVAASTVAATSGVLRTDGSTAVTIAIPPRLNTGSGELQMNIQPSVAASITDSFRYLRQFPHYCIEQTVSRFLPNLATYQALKHLNLSDADLEKNLTEQMTAAMQKLADEQKPEGGWGWYPEMRINPLTSAYAALSLIEARNAGFAVDQTMLDHAVGYVQTLIGRTLGASDWELNQYAFFLYVMARDGKGDFSTYERVLTLRTRMSYAARAYLLMAYHERLPSDPAVQTLTSDLIGGATITQNGIYWDEPYNDWWNWGSDTKTTALALTALIRTDPSSELLPDIVRWLMSARRGDHWPTTQETVWSITALSEWMIQTGELQGKYDFAVSLNTDALLRGSVTPDTVRADHNVRVAVSDLLQSNRLVITRGEGDGALYYDAYVKLYAPAKDAQPVSQGITITREYFNATRDAAITSATVGDVINVRLTINVKQDVLYFALEDSIPAGTEPIDKSLLTSSIGAGDSTDRLYHRWYWDWGYFQQRELRDTGLRLYADYLPAGTYVYTYQIQASLPGLYQVIPTQAYTFYVTDIFGATAGTSFEVLPPAQK